MKQFDLQELKKLYVPASSSHKGQNGKMLLVGGSHLFHAASLWSLKMASRIVDMVFYASVPENNEIVRKAKEEFRDGIVIPRSQLESYIEEADCILIGPGMVRTDEKIEANGTIRSLAEIDKIEQEGIQTYYITKYLLEHYPLKRWVIDAGALQMMEPEWLVKLGGKVIVTPHTREFSRLFNEEATPETIQKMAEQYKSVILVKGEQDVVSSPTESVGIPGGNPGMTKGGTGDVLSGLVAALACKNDMFLAACAGSYINKKAGEKLFERMGVYFNASDLTDEIPLVMKQLLHP